MKRLLQTFACMVFGFLLFLIAIKPAPLWEGDFTQIKEEKTTIRIWYRDEGLSDYLSHAAVEFGQNRNVRVLPMFVKDEGAFLEMVYEASINGQQAPDLYFLGSNNLEEAYLSGLADAVDQGTSPVSEENFPKSAVNAVTYKGKTVAYPFSFDCCILLYNDTYLEMWAEQQAVKYPEEYTGEDVEGSDEIEEMDEIPSEEDSLIEYDEETLAIRKKQFWDKAVPGSVEDILNFADTFDSPQGLEGVFAWDVSDIMFNYYFVGDTIQIGGPCGDDRTILDVNNEKTLEALEMYQSLNQFFFMETEGMDYDSILQDFLDGKYVFTIVKKDAIAKLEEAVEGGSFPYQYGYVTLPDPTKNIQGKSLAITDCLVVNGFSEQKSMAREVAAFLVDGYAKELYDRSGRLPASLHALEEQGPQSVFMYEYRDSVSLPKIMEYSNYWLQLENIFSRVWDGGEVEKPLAELDEMLHEQVKE